MHPGESRIEITLSPGIGCIALYASANLYFPSEEEHTWSAGIYKAGKLTDIDDFTFEIGDYFDPDPYDAIMKRDFTKKDNHRESHTLTRIDERTGEPLRFCTDTDEWKYSSQVCYLGIKNLTDVPIEFEMHKREVLEEELLTGEIHVLYEAFKKAFLTVEGSSISQSERTRLNCSGKSEFTYGTCFRTLQSSARRSFLGFGMWGWKVHGCYGVTLPQTQKSMWSRVFR